METTKTTNWENAISLYHEFYPSENSQTLMKSDKEENPPEESEGIKTLKKLIVQVVDKLENEGIIRESDKETIIKSAEQTVQAFTTDKKKTAIVNLIIDLAVPAVMAYFLAKKSGGNPSGSV